MTSVLLDTHAWAWSLAGDDRLSPRALAAIKEADTVFVSPITFFEIAQKVRLGKWPEMVAFIGRLPGLLQSQGGVVAEAGAGAGAWPTLRCRMLENSSMKVSCAMAMRSMSRAKRL